MQPRSQGEVEQYGKNYKEKYTVKTVIRCKKID